MRASPVVIAFGALAVLAAVTGVAVGEELLKESTRIGNRFYTGAARGASLSPLRPQHGRQESST